MKKNKIIAGSIGIITLSILPFSTVGYSADLLYEKKFEIVCDTTKVQIKTKCEDYDLEGPPPCGEQSLTLIDLKTGRKTTTWSYGNPYNKEFEGAGVANAVKCVKGQRQQYISLWYSTGGNCEECEWQSVIDLKGNRIATDINKKNRILFKHKWKTLGLPNLDSDDFTAIPLKKNE